MFASAVAWFSYVSNLIIMDLPLRVALHRGEVVDLSVMAVLTYLQWAAALDDLVKMRRVSRVPWMREDV